MQKVLAAFRLQSDRCDHPLKAGKENILLPRFKRVITSITLKPESCKNFLHNGPLWPRIIPLTYPPVQSYVCPWRPVATPLTNMIDLFARRWKLPTRAIGMTDVL